jgi:predicted nucleotidyltransferase
MSRIVHIGEVIRNAVLFDFKNLHGERMGAESLIQTVEDLFRLLDERRIDYLLVGGIAMLQYVEGRNTEDIDLIMAVSSLERLPEIRIESRDEDFARGRFDGLQVDLLLTRNPLFEEVRLRHATTRSFVEREIPCATVEGLLLLKLYALPSLYRQGNFARVGLYENDIATLLHDYRPDIERLLGELSPYLSATDMAEVQKLLAEIRQRVERFGKVRSELG